MKRLLLGAVLMITGCATSSVEISGFIHRYDGSMFPYRVSAHQWLEEGLPHYTLEYCGVVSKVERRLTWWGAIFLGNRFEEWAQFAYQDQDGNAHRINIKIFTLTRRQYLSEDDMHRLTRTIADEMKNRFGNIDWPPRLYYFDPTSYVSAYKDNIDLVYRDQSKNIYFVQSPLTHNDWQMATEANTIDVYCPGLSTHIKN